MKQFHHIQLKTKVFRLSSVYSSSLVFSHHTLLLQHFQQNETKHGRGYLFEKETPIDTNEVYSHGVGISEDGIALSSKSFEIFFSSSSDKNATIFAVKEWNMHIQTLKPKATVFIGCEHWSYKEYDQLKMEEFKEDYCKKL